MERIKVQCEETGQSFRVEPKDVTALSVDHPNGDLTFAFRFECILHHPPRLEFDRGKTQRDYDRAVALGAVTCEIVVEAEAVSPGLPGDNNSMYDDLIDLVDMSEEDLSKMAFPDEVEQTAYEPLHIADET